MPYFADGSSKYKLMILYFLKAVHTELTREQLTTVFAWRNMISYFDLQSALAELEQESFVAAVPRAYGQAYAITAAGEETLQMFEEQLPQSLRDDLLIHAESQRDELRRETQFSTYHEQNPYGGVDVMLSILERENATLRLRVRLPDAQTASEVCKAWPDRAQRVYQAVIKELTE